MDELIKQEKQRIKEAKAEVQPPLVAEVSTLLGAVTQCRIIMSLAHAITLCSRTHGVQMVADSIRPGA